MAMTPEGKVKKQVVEILQAAGAWHCFPVASGYGRSGIPDILACYNGGFVAIECKTVGNSPTALQERELKRIEAAGGETWVIDEHNIGALKVAYQKK